MRFAEICRLSQRSALLLALCVTAPAQQATPPQTTPAQAAAAQALPELTPEQQALFSNAQAAFNAQRWTEAAVGLAMLHGEVPNQARVTKMYAEAEIHSGKARDATALLGPLLSHSPDDAQALAILAQAEATLQTWPDLDRTLSRLQTLHDEGKTRLNQIPLGEELLPKVGQVQWLVYLEPHWSRYNVYNMARVLGPASLLRERLTLESGDFDQPQFAKDHPAEAAKGVRSFSLDGYVDTENHTQTHYTYAFFNGRPSFETFREKVLAVSSGALKPMSSRTNLPMPPAQ